MRFLKSFFETESASGIVLMISAALAMALANSPLQGSYEAALHLPLPLGLSLLHWINDGLMALFFLLIGIEIKRELVEGELSSRRNAILPFAGALGGVIVPALIYWYFNAGDAAAMRGWAVPTATDIAFSLGILALLGSRVPAGLKIFLMAVAVIDDLIAVIVIALFYTAHIDIAMLTGMIAAFALLLAMNRAKVKWLSPYLLIGAALWYFTLRSGIHATIAGVLLGLVIPLSIAQRLMHALHPWVAFAIVPLFALANGGIPLAGLSVAALAAPVPLGIAAGLVLGKQIGIFLTCRILVMMRFAAKPSDASWCAFYATCILAGIGFTMSLFIGNLAFGESPLMLDARLGIMSGSLCSAVMGYIVLARTLPPRSKS